MVHVQDPHLLENPAQDEVYEELEETTVDPHQNFPDAVKEELKTELPMDEDEESSVDGSSGSISNPFDFGEKKEDVSSNETEDVKLEADEEEPLAAANMPAADKNISPSLPEEAKSSTAAAENVVDEFKSSEVVPEVTEISTENVDQEDNLDTRSEASSTLLTSGEAITESDGKDIGNANAPTVSQTTQPIQTALEEDSPSPDSPVPVTTTELMASSVPESSGTEALSKESTPNQVRESKRASVRGI